jgi:choline dehydrogenase
MRALLHAAVDTGLPPADDSTGCRTDGVFWQESNVVAGRRQRAADAYSRRAATITVERDVVTRVIGSPQILVLSGIGPAEHLHEHDVAVRMNLPGVGANFHDHPLSWISLDARDVHDSPAPPQAVLR